MVKRSGTFDSLIQGSDDFLGEKSSSRFGNQAYTFSFKRISSCAELHPRGRNLSLIGGVAPMSAKQLVLHAAKACSTHQVSSNHSFFMTARTDHSFSFT